jgi:integrase
MPKIKKNSYNCILGTQMIAFINKKHDEGCIYETGENRLKKFNLYCNSMNLVQPILTQQFIVNWLDSIGGLYSRDESYLSTVRLFSKYLNSLDSNNYIVPYKIPGSVQKEYHCISFLSSIIKELIEQKNSEGYAYKSESKVLKNIDKFCIKQNITKFNQLTKHFFNEWIEDASYQKNYWYLVRQLCIYIKIYKGIDIDVPDSKIKEINKKVPYLFHSVFKNLIIDFINDKRRRNYKYEREERILKQFDRFCIEIKVQKPELTKEIVIPWSVKKPSEIKNSMARRVTVIRELAEYLISIGFNAFIAPNLQQVKVETPHIFKNEELVEFFHYLNLYSTSNKWQKLSYTVVFRFYYCMGLRLNEALLIECRDINLKTGTVLIRAAKNLKDRLLYLPDDLLELAIAYDNRINKLIINRKYFFISNILGDRIRDTTLCKVFNNIWNKTSYCLIVDKKPTIHGFRHTLVVRKLEEWYSNDMDLSYWLPFLSAHLGHTSVESTFYYIHLVSSAYPIINRKMKSFEDLYPEDL